MCKMPVKGERAPQHISLTQTTKARTLHWEKILGPLRANHTTHTHKRVATVKMIRDFFLPRSTVPDELVLKKKVVGANRPKQLSHLGPLKAT